MADSGGDALRLLFVKLGFDVDEQQLKNADNRYSELKSKLELLVRGAKLAWSAVRGLTTGVAEQAVQVKATAQQLGVTTQALQELQHAANMNESSAAAMSQGLRFLARAAAAAGRGSQEAAQSFGALGINAVDAGGKLKDPSQLMYEIADAFQRMPDGSQKAALAMQLLGRGGSELIPTLNAGSSALAELGRQAREMGVVFDAEALAAAGRMDDATDELGASLQGLRNIIGLELLPAATDVVKSMVEWIRENRELIKTRIHQVVTALVVAFRALKALLTPLVAILGAAARNTWVLVAAVTALALLMLGRAGFAVGQFVLMIGQIRLAHLGAAAAAMAQNAATVLLGLKWLAVAAIVALVFEDVYQYLTGGKSLIGGVIKKVDDLAASLWRAFIAPHDGDWWIVEKIRAAGRAIESWGAEHPDVYRIVKMFAGAPLDAMTGKLQARALVGIKGMYQAATGDPISSDVRQMFLGGGASPAASAPVMASSSRTINVPAINISIPVTTNASPLDIANAVRPVVRDELGTVFREAAEAHE